MTASAATRRIAIIALAVMGAIALGTSAVSDAAADADIGPASPPPSAPAPGEAAAISVSAERTALLPPGFPAASVATQGAPAASSTIIDTLAKLRAAPRPTPILKWAAHTGWLEYDFGIVSCPRVVAVQPAVAADGWDSRCAPAPIRR